MSLLRRFLGDEPSDGAASRSAESATPSTDRSVREIVAAGPISKVDVVTETGLTPKEFLVAVVRIRGGRTYQKDLVETTGWSGSSVSRLLGELEADGVVERVQVGREKIVYLEESVPEGLAAATERGR